MEKEIINKLSSTQRLAKDREFNPDMYISRTPDMKLHNKLKIKESASNYTKGSSFQNWLS